MTISREDLRALIAEGVELAFERLGIDVEDRAAMRADFLHLRRMRLWSESVWSWVMKTAVGISVAWAASRLWGAVTTMDFHFK